MKNIILSGLSVILTLLGTYYFQLYTVPYFDNGLFRWSLGLVVSTFLVCLAALSIFKGQPTSEPKSWEQATGVFRLHKNKEAYVEGWLIPKNDYLKDRVDRDLIGYIPLNSKSGKPQYMSSYSVDHIEFLFNRKLPKYKNKELKTQGMSPKTILDSLNEGKKEVIVSDGKKEYVIEDEMFDDLINHDIRHRQVIRQARKQN